MNSKTYQKRNTAVLVVLLVAAGIAALFAFRSCGASEGVMADTPVTNEVVGIVYDENATVGGWEETDAEAVVDSLNEKVEQGMINISMNTTPVFSNGTSAGNLMIVNEGINNYPQIVEITAQIRDEFVKRYPVFFEDLA